MIKTKILRQFTKTKKQFNKISKKLSEFSKRAKTIGRKYYLILSKKRQLYIKVYKLAVIFISLVIITDSAHAYTPQIRTSDLNIDTVNGTTEQINLTVSKINSYIAPKISLAQAINDGQNSSSEVFVEKPAITETQSREQIENQKKQAEYERQLAQYNNNRNTFYRDSSTTRNDTAPQENVATPTSSAGNTYSYGYCTWYVKNMRPDLPNQLGNGGAWYYNAQLDGLSTGQIPEVGSVVVTAEGGVGHVGYVQGVNGNEITISEMNFYGWGIVNQRTLNANGSLIKGYVY